jgi:hypothetical protein
LALALRGLLPVVVLRGDDLGDDAAYARRGKRGVTDVDLGEERDSGRTTCRSCFCVDEALSFVELDSRSQAR